MLKCSCSWPGKPLSSSPTAWPAAGGFTEGGQQRSFVNLKCSESYTRPSLCFELCSRCPCTALKWWTIQLVWQNCPNPLPPRSWRRSVVVVVVSAGGGERLPHTWEGRTSTASCCYHYFWWGFGGEGRERSGMTSPLQSAGQFYPVPGPGKGRDGLCYPAATPAGLGESGSASAASTGNGPGYCSRWRDKWV